MRSSLLCFGSKYYVNIFKDAKLKNKLKKKAEIESGKVVTPLPREKQMKIKIAPFQVATQDRDWSQMARSHSRGENVKSFDENLEKCNMDGIVSHKELFKKALEHATAVVKNFRNGVTSEKNFVSVYGNIVGVIGYAGIGKTTLSKELVQKAINENLFGEIDYVCYLRFRDINMEVQVNLIQFLTNEPDYFQDEDRNQVKGVCGKLDESDSVLIVLDGYDEAALKGMTESCKSQCSFSSTVKAEVFIKNILAGNVLPRAKKLITSRPEQMREMHEDYQPKFVVNLLGIGKDSQEQTCEDIVSKNEENKVQRKKEILQFLENNQDLRSYCYVPAICIIIMYCVYANLEESLNMDSLTTIMVTALKLFIEQHLLNKKVGDEAKRQFQIQKLCLLAYNGFKADRYYFTASELKDVIVDENAVGFFAIGKNRECKLLKQECKH